MKKLEAATQALCTYLITEFTLPDKAEQMKTCYPDIEQVNDDSFTISNGLFTTDRSTLAFFLQDKLEVKFLPTNLYTALPELLVIRFWNCSAASVNENHFKGLTKLRTLSLFHNKIENIASDAFADLVSLEYLDLDDNRIHFLGKYTFASLNALKKLNLDINEIQYLHPETFSSLKNVEIINLSRNVITSLDENVFQFMTSVKHIYLMSNRLERIPENVFQNNLKRKVILLNNNRIRFIAANLFDELPNLENVDLSGNECTKRDYFTGAIDQIYEDCNKDSILNTFATANAIEVSTRLLSAIESSKKQKAEQIFKSSKKAEQPTTRNLRVEEQC